VRRRAPRPIGDAVQALTDSLAPATLLGDVQRVWVGAVGAAIAREAEPIGERAGTVTVLCSSSVWAHEIDLLGPTLSAQLNAALGAERVRGLRCTATRGRRPSPAD
jgi:predicted nucleic acid-binding Zn ribbon protein